MKYVPHFLLITALSNPLFATAQSVLYITHVQSKYEGGGGCIENFDIHWVGEKTISNIEIKFELSSPTDEPLQEIIKIDELGITNMDNDTPVKIETGRCFQNNATIYIKEAIAIQSGKKIDFLKTGQLEIGKVVRYPIKLMSKLPIRHR